MTKKSERRVGPSGNLRGVGEIVAEKKVPAMIQDLHDEVIAYIFYTQRFNKFA